MTFIDSIRAYLKGDDQDPPAGPADLDPALLDLLNGDRVAYTSQEWSDVQQAIEGLSTSDTRIGRLQALRLLDCMLRVYRSGAANEKGISAVDTFVREQLAYLLFDAKGEGQWRPIAAVLYGQSLALFERTAEIIPTACEDLLSLHGSSASSLVLSLLLGARESDQTVFEKNVPVLLRQIQTSAFASPDDTMLAKEALFATMHHYGSSDKTGVAQSILKTAHALITAALNLCESSLTMRQGVTWTCYIVEHAPMNLRFDLMATYGLTQRCTGPQIFSVLSRCLPSVNDEIQTAMCRAMPVLLTWDVDEDYAESMVFQSVQLMLAMAPNRILDVMNGLGGLASVVLHRFEPYIEDSGDVALHVLRAKTSTEHTRGAQGLLRRLLSATGPLALNIAMQYLQLEDSILLADVSLLETIGILLPNLDSRINHLLGHIIDSLVNNDRDTIKQESTLRAINAFPLHNAELAAKAQRLVLLSLDESYGKSCVLAALEIATSASIATDRSLHGLTYKISKLLLSEDPHIVHVALSVLSNPALASSLDDRSCSMILLALHQSLEPSIQIVAAKLLAHLSSVHRAIVQPLAWRHIRQSLSLMDFLQTVDPNRAIVEACIVSNLLPALPPALHSKYVEPVKALILRGLQSLTEGTTLSLIFQGLANLAKFEGWDGPQQSMLAMDLLEMSQDIPTDSKHAALNAISRLLSVPQKGVDVYEMLVNVHANFAFGDQPDRDLKAMIAGIYGSLGTIERNPTISRDSKAAIDRETTFYSGRTKLLAQIADTRERCGATNQTHINSLVSKTLLGTEQALPRPLEERYTRLELLSGIGISQPRSISSLAPELPSLILRELRRGIDLAVTGNEVAYVPHLILLLSSLLHVSNSWREQHYTAVAAVLSKGMNTGEAPAALRAVEVVLDALE